MNPPSLVIAGGGVAGLSLALALAQAFPGEVDVTLCDPALARDPRGDTRAYAVAAAARRMLEALGVWGEIAPAAQPILSMRITDSRLNDPVRPVFLTFGDEGAGEGVRETPGEPFAHMVESGALTGALLGACREAGVRLEAVGVSGFEEGEASIRVELADGRAIPAALLVAADGARSRLRERAGIQWIGWSYPQSGLVATVAHERDHGGCAVEHFLPAGPFAILPLTPDSTAPGGPLGHRSSIVWTERSEQVPGLMALGPAALAAEIEQRFGLQLGEIRLEGRVRAHPLAFGIARRFVGARLALLGDAAHVIHPIAGQGLNLGLKDAAALAEAVADALRLGLDFGDAEALQTYERARRFDTVAMGAVTDGLNRLFSNDALPLRLARDLGLGLVDRMPALKRFFIREAAGLAGEGPRLLRGEAL